MRRSTRSQGLTLALERMCATCLSVERWRRPPESERALRLCEGKGGEREAFVRPELWLNLGDGVNQAADFFSDATSIPSWNVTPLTTFGK